MSQKEPVPAAVIYNEDDGASQPEHMIKKIALSTKNRNWKLRFGLLYKGIVM